MRLVLILALLTLTACSQNGVGYSGESILQCKHLNEDTRTVASNSRGFSFGDGEIQWWGDDNDYYTYRPQLGEICSQQRKIRPNLN